MQWSQYFFFVEKPTKARGFCTCSKRVQFSPDLVCPLIFSLLKQCTLMEIYYFFT